MIRAWSAALALACFSLSFLVGLFHRIAPWERLHRSAWALTLGALLGWVCGWIWKRWIQPQWNEARGTEESA